ncbi:hypothetical protein ACH35V_37475 [Actinomadura sp. 1N219]|uniref:hypothetical protein n=1 Tax=Actinomadura sp. 1N219 TaxID=3375152 RepID=UPI00378E8EE1
MGLSFDTAYGDLAVLQCVAALRTGDWRPAAGLLKETSGDWDRKAHRVDRLAEDADCHPALAEWVAADRDNADAHMVDAGAKVVQAWEIRGSSYARHVDKSAWAGFFAGLHDAQTALLSAIERAPDDPTPWGISVLLARALQMPRREFDARWNELVRRDVGHVAGHHHALQYLCAKWSGSHEEMFGFADRSSAEAPPGSPLHILPVYAAIEYAMAVRDGRVEGALESEFWESARAVQAVEGAVERWETPAAASGTPPHARAVPDRAHLAFAAAKIGAGAVAARQYRAMGPYASDMPWGAFVLWPKLAARANRRRMLARHR